MLSAAGVGYFEFSAPVEGAETLGLDVPLEQVDDVLRSLAVFDSNGGVGSIELPGRDDVHRAFADVPFGQALLSSPGALLESLRGEELAVTGPQAATGRIVTAVTENLAVGAGQVAPVARTRVTLLTKDGFRQFILEDAGAVRLTDPGLAARVDAALAAARQPSAASVRHLTLRGSGQGRRILNVGYVVAAPLWKASYRVVLPGMEGAPARVQGWAVLENQSGMDWHGVDLTLHAGNPVTFHQAIYASYLADRPEVPVEVLGRLLPAPDERAVDAMQGGEFHASAAVRGAVAGTLQRLAPLAMRNRMEAPPPPPPMAEAAPGVQEEMTANINMAPASNRAEGAESAIDTSFHIAVPFDLAAGHTANVPILDRDMNVEQLDLLEANSVRPVSALRLTNDGTESLPAGVLTLYATDAHSGRSFAGDARLAGLPAGESRIVAFAEDLRTGVQRSADAAPQTLLRISVADGELRETMRVRLVYRLTLSAPPHEGRRILVAFQKTPDASFSVEGGRVAGQDETASSWRVPVTLAAGEVRHLTAYADSTNVFSETLLRGDTFADEVLLFVLGDRGLDAETRDKLRPLRELRAVEKARQAAVKRLTEQQTALDADESRVRENLRSVMGPEDLHGKLVAALDKDETALGALKPEIEAAQAAAAAAHAALAEAVRNLVI
jgi:hypothetical protein